MIDIDALSDLDRQRALAVLQHIIDAAKAAPMRLTAPERHDTTADEATAHAYRQIALNAVESELVQTLSP